MRESKLSTSSTHTSRGPHDQQKQRCFSATQANPRSSRCARKKAGGNPSRAAGTARPLSNSVRGLYDGHSCSHRNDGPSCSRIHSSVASISARRIARIGRRRSESSRPSERRTRPGESFLCSDRAPHPRIGATRRERLSVASSASTSSRRCSSESIASRCAFRIGARKGSKSSTATSSVVQTRERNGAIGDVGGEPSTKLDALPPGARSVMPAP